jgi:endonuclease YncB( thermonuclease family)
MNLKILILSFAFFLLPCGSYAGQFEVIWIFDGDTFRAEGHNIEIVVRFIAIDAPEISYKKGEPSQPFSNQSKKALMDMILYKTVEIKGYGLDKNNRLLAVVTFGGKNIGVEMIRLGLAEVYRGEMPDNFDLKDYKQAEFDAKTARRGMWNQGNNYVSPREWRERGWRRERISR